jgi:hypothetical protein
MRPEESTVPRQGADGLVTQTVKIRARPEQLAVIRAARGLLQRPEQGRHSLGTFLLAAGYDRARSILQRSGADPDRLEQETQERIERGEGAADADNDA